MRGTRIALAVTTFALAATPASAHVAATLASTVETGPALTSEGAVFATHGPGGWHVKLLATDGTVRVLRQFDSLVRQGSTSFPAVAASPGRVAVSDTRQYCYTEPEGLRDSVCDPVRIEYREATPGEATSRVLETCGKPARAAPPHAIDVTDDAVAYIGCNTDDADAVVVRSLSNPGAAPYLIRPAAGMAFDAVRIAGRYVAAELIARNVNDQAQSPVLVVYDREARQELYRVTDYSSDQGDFALDENGTVAIARGKPDGSSPDGDCLALGAPEYYTPAEPFAHALSRRACWPGFALADGRLVYQAFGGARPPRSQLILAGLGGDSGFAVAATSRIDERAWDLDPTRVAYTDSTCVGYADRLVMSSLEELRTSGFRPAERCPIGFARRRPVLERPNGVLAVRVRCPRGCTADLTLRPLGRRRPFWQFAFTARAGGTTITDFRLFYPSDTPRTIVRRRCAITLTSLQPDGTEKKVRIVRRLRFSKRA